MEIAAAVIGIGLPGGAAVEVEDRAYEGSLDRRKASLIQSRRFLAQFTA